MPHAGPAGTVAPLPDPGGHFQVYLGETFERLVEDRSNSCGNICPRDRSPDPVRHRFDRSSFNNLMNACAISGAFTVPLGRYQWCSQLAIPSIA